MERNVKQSRIESSNVPLQNYQLKSIKIGALILGALTPFYIGFLLWGGPVSTEFIGISIWIVSPYFAFFVVTELLERFSSIKNIFLIDSLVAVLLFVFSIWAYSIALDETSDTSGVIFIFGPAWVYVVSYFALSTTLLVAKLMRK